MDRDLRGAQQEYVSRGLLSGDMTAPPSYEATLASQTGTMPRAYSQEQASNSLHPGPRPALDQMASTSSSFLTTSSALERPNTVTRTASANHLGKVIAVPATMPSLGSPFLRAYPPSLENYNISRELFLKFLDDLNRISVKNPPLQILGLSAGIVGFVPLATAQIVSGAVQMAANVGTFALSKGRTELFLRDVNRTIFAPRGLKCEIARIDAVAKLAGIPILDDLGKVQKNVSILEPIDDLLNTAGPAPSTLTSQQRRLQALEPYIAHLDLEPLPVIDVPNNPLSKLSAAASERERKSGEKKMSKSRNEASEKYFEEKAKIDKDLAKDLGKLEKKEAKELGKGAKPDKMRKIQKEKREVMEEYEEEMEKISKDRRKDDKEESGMRKILWVLIRALDANDQVDMSEA